MKPLDRLHRDARRCHAAALAAVEPGGLVARALVRDGMRLCLHRPSGEVADEHDGPVLLLAAGKAAPGMIGSAVERVGASLRQALAIVPREPGLAARRPVRVMHSTHPLPTAASVRAGSAALALAAGAAPAELLVLLLSGGASSLMAAPAPGMTIRDKRAVTRLLLGAGADIADLNTVRKHCSALKGGGLLRAAARARAVWTLALSDVLGDDLATIGSGPTVDDPTSFADALGVLERLGVRPRVPAAVMRHFEAGRRGAVPDTLKPGDPALARGHPVVIGSNATAVAAAATAAEELGYATTVLPPLVGDAAAAGRAVVERLRAMPAGRAGCVIAGAEPTVRVVAGGRGGRAQHLALAAALGLAGTPGVVLAAGTDGVDGPTDAAGALVDGTLAARASRRGIDLAAALRATDSHRVLDALGALVRTGPTGTNVADLVVALRPAC